MLKVNLRSFQNLPDLVPIEVSLKILNSDIILKTFTYTYIPILSSHINPFMLNVFSHPFQLNESIFNFRVVGWYFSFLFKIKKKLLFANVPLKERLAYQAPR